MGNVGVPKIRRSPNRVNSFDPVSKLAYSLLRASIGSIRIALRAGISVAHSRDED